MIDVSIIFVNYNTCQLTCDAIASVYQFTKNLNIEIIVSDNDSKDDSISTIKNAYPKVKIIENKENLGFGRANNKGMKIAKGKYIFLLNTDTYLINNAIEVLFKYMEDKTNSKVGVSGALLFKTDLSHNVSAGNFPNYKLFVKGSFWKLFYSKGFYETASRTKFPFFSDKPYKVDYVSGADFFVRKSIIDKIGGFDERFFMYGEDAELSFRIKNKLFFSSIIVPEAKIVHISQGSSENGSQSRKFKYQFIKSRATYYKITEGFIASALYFVTSLKRLYI